MGYSQYDYEKKLPALYIGVGEGRGDGPIKLTATATFTEYISYVESASTRDGRLNIRMPENVINFAANSPILQEMAREAVLTASSDLRAKHLRMAILEDLREQRVTNPTGVEYSAAAPGIPPSEFILLDRILELHFTYIAIDYSVLDWALRHGGIVPVVGEERGWSLRDPAVAIVVLDKSIPNLAYCSVLQLLAVLPFPLLWRSEYFGVNSLDGPEVFEVVECLRTSTMISCIKVC